MHNVEAGMLARSAETMARTLASDAARAAVIAQDVERLTIALEHAHSLLEEVAKCEGALPASLRQLITDVVGA